MRTVIAAIFILLAIATAVLFTTAGRRSPPAAPKVTVTFLGYTNSAASGFLACFAVINASPGPVIRHVGYNLQSPATTTSRWMRLSEGWFTNQGNLKVGDSEVVLVPVPTNVPAWRLSLTVLRDEPLRMMATSLAAEARRLASGRQRTTKPPPARSYEPPFGGPVADKPQSKFLLSARSRSSSSVGTRTTLNALRLPRT